MLISLVIPVFALLVIGGIIWMIIEGIVHISKKNKAIDNFFNQVNKVSETYKFATTFFISNLGYGWYFSILSILYSISVSFLACHTYLWYCRYHFFNAIWIMFSTVL
ncbi:hypothetical protein Y002_06200 [Staphylococcus aureus MUM270]|nr:hypothetical protein Y002_06200 [Staphylococcus aureus MUM270]